ncbi:MAG: biopolymer transporter ExbD [Leptospiraceae bacterium]|nr:biopolymer transporter ExbD [Leptospiraceae bacterium]
MKKRKTNPIDMSSLLDIIFILLIFSMLAMSFQKEFASVELQLPKEQGAPSNTSETKIQISLKENGELFFQNQKVTWSELENLISGVKDKSFQLGIEKKVYYEDFLKLTVLLKKFGIEKVELLVEPD